MRWEIPDSETACSRFLLQTQTFWSTIWNRTIKMITKSAWALGLGGGVIINYSGTVTWEVLFCSSRLFSSFIRGAMNQVSSTFGKLNKQIQELSLLYVSVYLVVKMMNVQLSARPSHNMINKDKQLFLSVASIFQPLAWAAVKRGPGLSPPYSITSWNYSCKSNVKGSLRDYNTVGESFFNTPAHCGHNCSSWGRGWAR